MFKLMYIHRCIALQLFFYTVIVAMLVHEKYNTPPHCITIMALCRVRGDVGAGEVIIIIIIINLFLYSAVSILS